MVRGTRVSRLVVLGFAGLLPLASRAEAASFLNVTSPDIGTVWYAGSGEAITWTSSEVVGYVFIDLYQAGAYKQFIGYAPVGLGSYPWGICDSIGDASDYSIVLTGSTATGETVYGFGGQFAIAGSLPAPPTPTLTLTSPNGGENWTAGTAQAITWSSTDPQGYVLVQLEKDGGYHSYLGYALMADNRFDWDICAYVGDSTAFQVHLIASDVCGNPVEDVSDAYFSIAGSLPAPPTPTLALTSPTGGQNWAAGSTQAITWSTSNPLGDVGIDLYKADQYLTTLGTAPMAAGSLAWSICPSIENGTDYTIHISGADACGQLIQDSSPAPFAISGSVPAPSLAFTFPAGGEALAAGSVEVITWASTNPSGTCYLYLESFSGSTLEEIVYLGSVPMADGAFAVFIDQCQGRTSGVDYAILAVYGCDESLSAMSGFFGITPASIRGDLDEDCDVDVADVPLFESCAAGPDVDHDGTPACLAADLDGDFDVDSADFSVLQRCLSNASLQAAPECLR